MTRPGSAAAQFGDSVFSMEVLMSDRALVRLVAFLAAVLFIAFSGKSQAQSTDRSIIKQGNLIISETSGKIWALDLESNELSLLANVHPNNFDIQYKSPSELIIANLGGSLQQLDLLTGQQSVLVAGPPVGNPIGVTIVPGHGYYFTDHFNNRRIVRFDPRRGVLEVVTSGGPGVPFGTLDGIAHEANGRLIVTDQTGGIYRISPSSSQVEIVATIAGYSLNGITIAPSGNFIVASHEPGAVFEVNASTGVITMLWEGPPLRDPEDVALDPHGNIYILDSSFQHPADFLPGVYRLRRGGGVPEVVRVGQPFGDVVDLLITPFDGYR
jgi:outer membrane protein assembly factor BamB